MSGGFRASSTLARATKTSSIRLGVPQPRFRTPSSWGSRSSTTWRRTSPPSGSLPKSFEPFARTSSSVSRRPRTRAHELVERRFSQLATTQGVIAVTVAVRGTRIVRATSPKNSPALRIRRSPSADCETPATPERRTKNRSPGSPSRMSTVPDVTSSRSIRSASLPGVSPGKLANRPTRASSVTDAGTCRGDTAVRYPCGDSPRLAVLSSLPCRAHERRLEGRVLCLRVRALRERASGGSRARGRRCRSDPPRAAHTHEPHAGLWDTLGGFLEVDEHPLAGLRREIREEAGVAIAVGNFGRHLSGSATATARMRRSPSISCGKNPRRRPGRARAGR